MRTTPELLEAWKDAAERAIDHGHPIDWSVERKPKHIIRDLIADLEEAQHMNANQIHRIKYLENASQTNACEAIALASELAAVRKQLSELQLKLDDRNSKIFDLCGDIYSDEFPDLDAAIAEAIADEKRNPWKRAIINELIVSHILHTDHETDPVRALAALVDYECKVALDPAVSKEAQALIEPYRKDAERLDLLGKLCKEIPLRPTAFCSEIAPDTRLKYEFPTLVSYDAIGQQISLRDAIDAAIAAKVKNE